MPFYVYVVVCKDGSYYTGFTKSLEARFKRHLQGRGSLYLKLHRPERIVYVEEFASRSEAIKRERQIKKWSHKQKCKLAAG